MVNQSTVHKKRSITWETSLYICLIHALSIERKYWIINCFICEQPFEGICQTNLVNYGKTASDGKYSPLSNGTSG
jgi:hypothetical protein